MFCITAKSLIKENSRYYLKAVLNNREIWVPDQEQIQLKFEDEISADQFRKSHLIGVSNPNLMIEIMPV